MQSPVSKALELKLMMMQTDLKVIKEQASQELEDRQIEINY